MGPKQIAIAGLGVSAIAGGAGGVYYLSQDKTIKDKLTSQGIKLILENAENKFWQIAWNENKEDQNVKGANPIATNADTLKIWCTKTYQEPLSKEEELEKVKKLCIVPPLTMEEKLNKHKKIFTSDWEDKHSKVKGTSGLLNKLQGVVSGLQDVNNASEAKVALEKWCNKQKSIELVPDTYESKYQEIVSLCV